MASLPQNYHIVSTLYFMAGVFWRRNRGYGGMPCRDVRSRLHRGRRMLQKALWQLAEHQGIMADISQDRKEDVPYR